MKTDTPITDALYESGAFDYEEIFDFARRLERDRADLIAALENTVAALEDSLIVANALSEGLEVNASADDALNSATDTLTETRATLARVQS